MKFHLFLVAIVGLLSYASANDNPSASNIHAVLISAITCDLACEISYAVEAEIAHAYHLLRENGVPANQIIVFHLDDVTNNELYNPKPGTLCTDKNLTIDYREGLQIDYTGDDLTIENVLAVLQGEKDKVKGGNGRVLESGPNDHVFIFHGGHGKINNLAFPKYTHMTSKELNDALKVMQSKKMYKELVFYLLACESGSMFDRGQLTDKENIYALTAAKRNQSAWGKDCNIYQSEEGEEIDICVNTEYGIGWLNDTEKHDTFAETFDEQYNYLKSIMKKSEPVQFGDLSIAKETLANFEGHANEIKSKGSMDGDSSFQLPISRYSAYLLLKQKLQNAKSYGERKFLQVELQKMETEQRKLKEMADKIVSGIIPNTSAKQLEEIMTKKSYHIDFQNCNHFVVKHVEKKCKFVLKSPFSDEIMDPLSNLCDYGANAEAIIQQLNVHC